MQISASLDGTTATIATNNCGIKTTLTITEASNLASDLSAFADDPNADLVDATASITTGTMLPTTGGHHSGGGRPKVLDTDDLPFTMGGQTPNDRQVIPRGYLVIAKDDLVQVSTHAGTSHGGGKVTVPREQITSIIAQLNA